MFILKLIVVAMLLVLAVNGYGAEQVASCPSVNGRNNVFDASVLVRDSRISIEHSAGEYPLALDFYRPTEDGCERVEFARYSIEGGMPEIGSIFFMILDGHINIFSIVFWKVNSRGDGAYGRLYQVHAYKFDENLVLVENKRVAEDSSMSGIEGYVAGQESRFRYRTASEVKKYWAGKQR